MSRPILPSPYNDYAGLCRDLLGEEYHVVLAVYNKLPEIREMVNDVMVKAPKVADDAAQAGVKALDTHIADLQTQLQTALDCAKQAVDTQSQDALKAAQTALQDSANSYRDTLNGWAASLMDSMKESQQPMIDEANKELDAAKDARVQAITTALQDAANTQVGNVNTAGTTQTQNVNTAGTTQVNSVNTAGNTMLAQIKAAQSNIQVLSYTNTVDDITQAPKPTDPTAPAILFFTLDQGKPANTFRAYAWNTTTQAWGTKTLEMTQPADGKQGNPGPAGNAIIATTFPSGQAVPAVTRPDGSPVIQGDLVLNGTNGSLWKNTSATVGSPTWTAAGSLLGPQGTTTVTGVDLFASAQSVRLFVQMYWDGGVNNKETVKWPYGYIFKSPPVTYFSSNIGGAGSSSYDPTTTPSDGWQANVSNQTISGFTYKHCGPWPGNGGEQLALVVEGIPDYAAMKAAGWTPTNDQVMNANTGRVPVGMPAMWVSTSIPFGWMERDGSTFDVNKWPQLAALFPSGQLPNDHGLFERAYDPTNSNDAQGSTRGLLSFQDGSPVIERSNVGYTGCVIVNSDTSDFSYAYDYKTGKTYPQGPQAWRITMRNLEGDGGVKPGDVSSFGTVIEPGIARVKNRNYVPVIYAGIPAY